ncbi:hypothetical protein [Paenibacillus sp. V4I5]|uniref:hypothetical protein n=1 Tax=Paenibacillus sp. V4I5 TaxID=3042306 RepID=UPI00278D653A|nr:hypothetical protein [Paenibacillus sp. V4I5]MDQ0913859.1 hypothetical protein [Paenibacillus sp. V4I5]
MKKFVLILTVILVCLVGCSNSQSVNKSNESDTVAKDYLQGKGYKVILDEGISETYTLTKEKLMSLPYSHYWGLQSEYPSKYLSKEVKVQKLTVTNHPLDNWKSTSTKSENIIKSKGKTNVWVYIVDNQAVGGHSYPHIDQQMYGGVWSLDGKTLEGVHSISFKDWSEQWKEKFGN